MQQSSESATTGPAEARPRRTHKQRFNRSRLGCLTCRGRKIKCDQTHPSCARCGEIQADCIWPAVSAKSAPYTRDRAAKPAGSTASASASTTATPHVSAMVTADMGLNAIFPGMDGLDWLSGNNGNVPGFASAFGQNDSRQMGIGSGTAGVNTQTGTEWNQRDPNDALSLAGPSTQLTPWSHSTTSIPESSSLFGSLERYTQPDPSAPSSQPINPALWNTHHVSRLSQGSTHTPQASISEFVLQDSALAHHRRTNPPAAIVPAPRRISICVPRPNPVVPSDAIENVFPSADSKRLFHHVRSRTSNIVVAYGTNDGIARNPYMMFALDLMLKNVTTYAQTAFRHALLSLAAAHAHHESHQASADQRQQMIVRTVKSRRKAMLNLSISALKDKGDQTDLMLITCLTLHIRDRLFAETKWRDCLLYARQLIMRQGGPEAMLTEPQNHPRRFLVEQLAVADLFSTFSTGEEPMFLGQAPRWWDTCENRHRTETEWEAFERYLGLTRGMVEMLGKCRTLVSLNLRQEDDPWKDHATAKVVAQAIQEQAERMLKELQAWAAGQSDVPSKKRVMNGDSAYRYTIEISLLVDVLSTALSDTRVQTAMRCVLELCSEMSQEPTNLLWPLLTAGSCAVSEADREWVRQLLSTFAAAYGRDADVAETLLREQWTRLDSGLGLTAWPRLMLDLGQQVCLM